MAAANPPFSAFVQKKVCRHLLLSWGTCFLVLPLAHLGTSWPLFGTMIHYDHGSWGICFLWQVKGSTLPKGLVWALPWSAISGGLCYLRAEAGVGIERIDAGTLLGAYGFFISLLAFMVAFRNNQGWSRYWEGATLLQQTRGEWFNAISSCFAFCSPQPEHKEKVVQFQDRAWNRLSWHLEIGRSEMVYRCLQ